MDIPQARRLDRPGWLNARVLLGLLLFLGALLGGQRIIESAKETVPVWTAARNLSSGTMLVPSDLVIIEVGLPSGARGAYALGGTDLGGGLVTRPIAAGEMVPLSSVADPGTLLDGRVVTIPVAPDHAVGGNLVPGDLIEVFATFYPGDLRARTIQLLSGVEVVDIVTAGGVIAGDDSPIGITVRIAAEDAARVAFALRNAEIDVVLVQGSTGNSPSSAVTAEDLER